MEYESYIKFFIDSEGYLWDNIYEKKFISEVEVMKYFISVIFILFIFCCSSVYGASTPTVYVNNKPFTGEIYVYGDVVYAEGSVLLTFMNVPHSTTATTLSIKDASLQEKLAKIAVWIDYRDGRGNVISFPLKSVAEAMGGRYKYYADTNTVDMISFSRNNQTGTNKTTGNQTSTGQTGAGQKSTGVSAPNPMGHSSGDMVNPFNTSKILHDAQNTVNLYQDQNTEK